MSNVIPFKFNSSEVRVIEQNGDPMFIAKDVADLLGYSNTSEAVRTHCRNVTTIGGSVLLGSSDYAGCITAGHSHNDAIRQYQIIPERDVYRLIMRSKMPEAEKFEDWVVGEVLPSIRKTGTYQPQASVPTSFAESLRLAADLAEKLEAAQPKIAFANAVNDAINSICVRDFAKSVGTGQNKLYSMMREDGYLMDSFSQRNRPYQRYIDQGLFRLQEKTRTDQNGETQIWFKTLVTAKGQLYFQNKFFNKAA